MSSPMKAASSSETKKIVLKSSDELEFKVEEAVARIPRTIRYMIEDGFVNDAIPLPIPSPILKKVLQYCEQHAAAGDADLVEFDQKFVEDFKNDEDMLFQVISMLSSRNDGASSSGSGNRKISLRSSDGVIFEVEEGVMRFSEIIRFMIDDGCANDIIPLTTITSKALQKVIQYCQRQYDIGTALDAGKISQSESEKNLIEFHKNFAEDLKNDHQTL